MRLGATLVDATVKDQGDLVSTHTVGGRRELGNVCVIADTQLHFRPFEAYVRAEGICIAIPCAEVQNGIFLELFVVAGVQYKTCSAADEHF